MSWMPEVGVFTRILDVFLIMMLGLTEKLGCACFNKIKYVGKCELRFICALV